MYPVEIRQSSASVVVLDKLTVVVECVRRARSIWDLKVIIFDMSMYTISICCRCTTYEDRSPALVGRAIVAKKARPHMVRDSATFDTLTNCALWHSDLRNSIICPFCGAVFSPLLILSFFLPIVFRFFSVPSIFFSLPFHSARPHIVSPVSYLVLFISRTGIKISHFFGRRSYLGRHFSRFRCANILITARFPNEEYGKE